MSNTDSRPLAIFLMGATASGKTDMAIKLHEQLDCDLISVDSAMVYREMDIGTAKPDDDERARAPHRLIDIRDPAEPYSVAEFRDDALREMRQITAAGRVPLLVGGSMLYYKHLVDGVANLPSANPSVRAELEAWRQSEGLAAMHAELARVDPEAATRISDNDPQRLMRALEVYRVTGKPMSELWREQRPDTFPWRTLSIGLAPADRQVLHERIATRFAHMLNEGFLDEVAALRERGDLHLKLPSMKSVGYRQAWEYLDGYGDRDTLYQRGVIATRQLAKRQITWMRGWRGLYWVDAQRKEAFSEVLKIVRKSTT
ncbi:tRNA (adenosine(37)-N6)-dimethylallyltransferase MiaA [Aidingimonas halophila]|uniref:tRNA dimethylallyltransferase n=1 Tax=Aidingimonas halophila TaxID=574349 RepID=A0A1H2R961_9GAMM|nr:tRNA (adenosine(37)-N6)-dimethylallyltransferase MiaA [Aidingimonas halophila]SDW15835.1 tRNA dimethylallyltransferase [Aidingimonas halophila]